MGGDYFKISFEGGRLIEGQLLFKEIWHAYDHYGFRSLDLFIFLSCETSQIMEFYIDIVYFPIVPCSQSCN